MVVKNKIIPNAHWEWPLGIEFLQWVFQPHSGRKDDDDAGGDGFVGDYCVCNVMIVMMVIFSVDDDNGDDCS